MRAKRAKSENENRKNRKRMEKYPDARAISGYKEKGVYKTRLPGKNSKGTFVLF